MEFDKKMFGLLASIYCLWALSTVWPYLSEVWRAFRNGRPVRQVPRPATNKLLAGALALIGGLLWSWQYFRH